MNLLRHIGPGLILGSAITISGSAQSMTCIRVESTPPIVRAEGLSELLPDIVLDCAGGQPTKAGSAIPTFEILAFSNAPLVNRLVTPPATGTTPVLDVPLPSVLYWNDAVLVLDDPLPSQQTACAPQADTDFCPANAGDVTLNVFQGQQLQNNAVFFRRVPIDPPGAGKTRRIRITNLRADATKVPASPIPLADAAPPTLTLIPQIYDRSGNQLAIQDAQMQIALTPGVTIELRTSLDEPVASLPLLTLTPAMVPQNAPGPGAGFNVKFREGFAGAFKRRNIATSGSTANLLVNQSDTATPFYTESGYFNGNLPETNDLNLIGLSDTGTRLKLTITGIPENVFLYVSTREVAEGTSGFSKDSPRAVLSYTDANGQGAFQQNLSPTAEPYNVVQPTSGVATMAWEIVAADPSRIEELSFNIRLMAPNGVARLGTARWEASLGPIYPGVPVPAPPSRPPFPAFRQNPLSKPELLFKIAPTLATSEIASVSAATMSAGSVAPGSIVSTFGSDFAATTLQATGAPVNTLGPIAVEIVDILGIRRPAPLYFISPGQLNFVISEETAPGLAVVNITNNGLTVASGSLRVTSVAPGLFSATGDGKGSPAGFAVRDGGSTTLAQPITIDTATYLSLYGTGIRGASSLSQVTLKVGGVTIPVTFAGPQPGIVGLDQVNAGPLPVALKGKGKLAVELTVDGKLANSLTIEVGP